MGTWTVDRNRLLGIAKDKKRGCVERGEAIVRLLTDHDIDQQRLPALTRLTETMNTRLKVCYENLNPAARKLCKSVKIQTQACHRLGREVARADQVRVFGSAQDFARKRESKRPLQNIGPRGRQSPKGSITEEDMQEAIRAYKYKDAKNDN
jgi:hypothetical protein